MTATSLSPEQVARVLKIREVACPDCGAAAGKPCTHPTGRTKGIAVHQARRRKAADEGVYTP